MFKNMRTILVFVPLFFYAIAPASHDPKWDNKDELKQEQRIVDEANKESWLSPLKEFGLKVGKLLLCYFIAREVIPGVKDFERWLVQGNQVHNYAAPRRLNPWEYVDSSGEVRSSYSTSAAISKNFPSLQPS